MRTLIATLVIVTAGVTASWAQPGYGPYGGGYGGGYGGYGGYGGWGGYGGNWGAGSTAAGSAAVGMGDLVRSQGMYNQMTAQAMISAEQARTLDLDNKMKSTQTYFEMRRINQEARLAEAQRNRAQAENSRYVAHVSKKPTLTVSQLDPVTGDIHWPASLLQESFTADRTAVQDVFARRAQHRIGTSAYLELRPVIDRMQATLNDQVKVLPPQDFVDSRRFLNMLLEESRSADNALASAAQ